MSSVYFDPAVGGDGSTITDDSNPSTGLANGGHRTRYVPSLANIVSVGNFSLTKANAAAASAVAANNWAVLTGGPVSGGEYSAKYHAQAAASSSSGASGYATTAQAWAVQLVTPVSGGEYSAKYHAQAAAGSATTANAWAVQLGSPVSGGEYSAKHHAQAAAGSAAAAASSAGSLSLPTLTSGEAGRDLIVNPAGNGWVLGSRFTRIASYDNRADLRSISPVADGDLVLVDGLGLFRYHTTGDEGLDDDETAFACGAGWWVLDCPTWEVVEAYTLLTDDSQGARLADAESALAKSLAVTSTQSAYTLAINSSTTFTVTVPGAATGAAVSVTPPGSPTRNTITVYAHVSSVNTVTVYIGNANSSSTGGFAAGDWRITVINK